MDICRLCLQKEPDLRPLSKVRIEQVFTMTTVQIIKPEDFQLYICLHCRANIDNWKQFKEQCKHNNSQFDELYEQLIESQKQAEKPPSPIVEVKNEPMDEQYSESSKSNDVPMQFESPLFQMFGEEILPDLLPSVIANSPNSDQKTNGEGPDSAKMRRIRDPTTIRYDISTDLKENLLSQVRKSVDGVYKCEFEGCTKSFIKLHLWKQHLDTHSTQKNYQCDICQRTFAHLSSLYKHKKSVKCAFKKRLSLIVAKPVKLHEHQISPRVKEEIRAKAKARASFAFPNEISVIPLKKTRMDPLAVPNISPQIARKAAYPVPNKSPQSAKSLAAVPADFVIRPVKKIPTVPLEIIQKESPPVKQKKLPQVQKFSCPICYKEFGYKNGLVLHMNSHERNPDRTFKCDVENCNKEFTKLTYYRQHQDTHSTERKYQCEMCMRKFSHSSSLSKHRKMHLANI